MGEELPFTVVRDDPCFQILARAAELPIARDVFRAIADLYPEDEIQLRDGAQVIECSRTAVFFSGCGAPVGEARHVEAIR